MNDILHNKQKLAQILLSFIFLALLSIGSKFYAL